MSGDELLGVALLFIELVLFILCLFKINFMFPKKMICSGYAFNLHCFLGTTMGITNETFL